MAFLTVFACLLGVLPTWGILDVDHDTIRASDSSYDAQCTQTASGYLSWVFLEGGISIIRLGIWALNPKSDDDPPIGICLAA